MISGRAISRTCDLGKHNGLCGLGSKDMRNYEGELYSGSN
jgi:hypothetical protein